MQGLLQRLVVWCNQHQQDADKAFQIIDYTLRKYGDEHHDARYWYEKASSGDDMVLNGMGILWSDFANIMEGLDVRQD